MLWLSDDVIRVNVQPVAQMLDADQTIHVEIHGQTDMMLVHFMILKNMRLAFKTCRARSANRHSGCARDTSRAYSQDDQRGDYYGKPLYFHRIVVSPELSLPEDGLPALGWICVFIIRLCFAYGKTLIFWDWMKILAMKTNRVVQMKI